MLDNFIYEMPCLSKYRFNHLGECRNIETGGIRQITKREGYTPCYQLIGDNGKMNYISAKEVLQYVKHLKALTEFDPLVIHTFAYYRPIIIRCYKEPKLTVPKDTINIK